MAIKDLVIFGAGGFGREATELVEDINTEKKQWNLLGYIDQTPAKQGKVINNYPILGNLDWLEKNTGHPLWIVCAVARPTDKYRLIASLSSFQLYFANLIHPAARISRSVQLGCGNIICWNSFLSTDVRIGSHVALNPGCRIGHDTAVQDYSSLYWDITLAGNVQVHEGCEIGSKTVVIPEKEIGRWSIIGAGATVTHDIPEYCTAVGVPARPIKHLKNLVETHSPKGLMI
ncbi:MAG: acetyltransferase [Dehalobacter sp.]|nr:acetyltransferase [Dehalobacter sp.]